MRYVLAALVSISALSVILVKSILAFAAVVLWFILFGGLFGFLGMLALVAYACLHLTSRFGRRTSPKPTRKL